MLTLLPPTTFSAREIEIFRQEFITAGDKLHGSEGLRRMEAADWLRERPWLKFPGNFTFLSYDDIEDTIIGCIRCTLANSASGLLNGAYNIGYAIRPTQRNKGYGTGQLHLALAFLESFGDQECALAAADHNNIASQKTMENCGGVRVWDTGDHYVYKFSFNKERTVF